ncbi:MATE family efflux transporter [Endozoicomonas montiporae]|uniref:Multidrug export protein MepA n=1 Tax=Endozoicomonas montiporae CL-33 TaxID=570277 RepID=A0A142B7E4_9GAMM|nr:MATE family efflux transporter [Endozoicomonas montiporae]AMO54670.1 Na+ driven multidrug efflux pump [Endozoicomonas montiporae CL-33]
MSQAIDLQSGSIGKTLFRYAVPSTMAVWIFALYTMVDGMFVGRGVGPEALAAVNLSMPYISIMFAISILVTIGSATIVGAKRGEGKHEDASRLFSSTIYALLIFGLLVCTLSYIFIEEIAVILGAQGELIPMVVEYLQTLLLFNTFYLVAYSMEVFVKVDGFPKLELMVIGMAAVMNILLDYILVIRLGMGLRGAAIATGCAQMTQATFLLLHFTGKLGKTGSLKFVRVMPKLRELFHFIKIGGPDCVTEMSAGLILLLFNNMILAYLGTSELSAFSVIGYANNLVLLTMIGLTQGMQPIVSFLRGRQDYQRISEAVQLTIRIALVICTAAYAGIFFFGQQLAALFLNDAELISLSHQFMKIFCLAFILMGANIVISGFFTALEQPRLAGTLSLMRGGVISFILLMTLPRILGATGIWVVAPVSELATFVVGAFLLKRKLDQWKETTMDEQIAVA